MLMLSEVLEVPLMLLPISWEVLVKLPILIDVV